MSKGNGHDQQTDAGLAALRDAFEGAKFLSEEAADCAGLMVLGAHRQQNITDRFVIEIYASLTQGKNVQVTFESEEGHGYRANLESYADLAKLLRGTLRAEVIGEVKL